MTKMVTFQTILDTARETPKAYKVYTGNYLAKSLVTVEDTGKTVKRDVFNGPGTRVVGSVVCPLVMVTMPEWLAKK